MKNDVIHANRRFTYNVSRRVRSLEQKNYTKNRKNQKETAREKQDCAACTTIVGRCEHYGTIHLSR